MAGQWSQMRREMRQKTGTPVQMPEQPATLGERTSTPEETETGQWSKMKRDYEAGLIELPEPDDLAWKEAIKSGILGAPKDFMELINEIYTGVKEIAKEPKKFAKGVGELAKTGVVALASELPGMEEAIETLTPEQQVEIEFAREEAEIIAGKVWESLKAKYGGIEEIKRTIAEDPVSDVMVDLSAALRTIGATAKTAGAVKFGEGLSKGGAIIEPLNIAGRAAVPARLPRWLYASATKMTKKLRPEEKKAIIDTALKNRVMPTIKGIEKLGNKISKYQDKVDRLIDGAVAGDVIPVGVMIRGFKDLKKHEFFEPDLNDIDSIRNQLVRANIKKRRGGRLTVKEAQELKKHIYKRIEKSYGTPGFTAAAVKARKKIAQNAKETVEYLAPGVKELNQKSGPLIKLYNNIVGAANRIEDRDLLGIGIPIKAAAGAEALGPKGALASITVGLIDTPTIKAGIALNLQRMRDAGIKIDKNWPIFKLGLAKYGKYKIEEKKETQQ